jgi:hypothetical protein
MPARRTQKNAALLAHALFALRQPTASVTTALGGQTESKIPFARRKRNR